MFLYVSISSNNYAIICVFFESVFVSRNACSESNVNISCRLLFCGCMSAVLLSIILFVFVSVFVIVFLLVFVYN